MGFDQSFGRRPSEGGGLSPKGITKYGIAKEIIKAGDFIEYHTNGIRKATRERLIPTNIYSAFPSNQTSARQSDCSVCYLGNNKYLGVYTTHLILEL